MTDDEWAREKLRWLLFSCLIALAGDFMIEARQYER